MLLIRKSVESDSAAMLEIINDAAQAYRRVIPVDQWREPYMPTDELVKEIAGGVVFWVAEQEGRLLGVIGISGQRRCRFSAPRVCCANHAEEGRGNNAPAQCGSPR